MKVRRLSILLLLFSLIFVNANSECLIGNCNSEYGIYKFKNGTMYEGFWLNGQPEGIGIKVHHNAGTQMGVWKNGVFTKEKDVRRDLFEIRYSLSNFYNNTELTPHEIINSIKKNSNTNEPPKYNSQLKQEENKAIPLWVIWVSAILAIVASILGIINHGLRISETND